MAPTYDPTVFNVASERQAKAIILTPEAAMTPEERWERETPDVVRRIREGWPTSDPLADGVMPFGSGATLLDWGCGIGRIARPLCHDYGLHVTGVDLSADMRRLAVAYVAHKAFDILGPMAFHDELRDRQGGYDAAIAIWALQHIPRLEQACSMIRDALKPGAPLFLLNRTERVIPVVGGWVPDGKSVPNALRDAGFTMSSYEILSDPLYAVGSGWSVWLAR